MKKFNLVLALLVISSSVMASVEAPAPVSFLDTVNKYAVVAYNSTMGYVDAADVVVVAKAQEYVVTPVIDGLTVAADKVKPATDKAVEYATVAKNFTCDAVQYPFAHPLKTTVVVAAVAAVYYAYSACNTADKKSKN